MSRIIGTEAMKFKYENYSCLYRKDKFVYIILVMAAEILLSPPKHMEEILAIYYVYLSAGCKGPAHTHKWVGRYANSGLKMNWGMTILAVVGLIACYYLTIDGVINSYSDGLPISSPSPGRGGQSHNAGAGGNRGSSAAVRVGTHSTGSGAFGGAAGGQGNGDDDNGDRRNLRRAPAAMVAGRDSLQLLFMVLGIILNLFNLFAALSSVDGNSVTVLFTPENAMVMIIVGVITFVIMLLFYLFDIIDFAYPPNN